MTGIEDVPCPLGCAPNDKVRLVAQDVLYGVPGEFSVVQCMTCKLLRTNPRPTAERMSDFYPEDYGPYLGTQVRATPVKQRGWFRRLLGPLVRSTWVPLHNAVVQLNATKVPAMPVGKMLEIGCASGSYLKEMHDVGWEVQGVEFSAAAGQRAQELGFQVYVGQLEEAPLPNGELDLVTGWMVLEHLHDPVRCLQKLRESAGPGAWLALSVPNAGALEFSVFGRFWYALQVPSHLYHFTPDTLRNVLHAGGWELKKVYHQRTLSNLVGSLGLALRDAGLRRIGQRLTDLPEKPGLWVSALYPLAWLLSLVGQTGRMTVWAQPKK